MILYCVPSLICITKYCTVLHPSSAQVWLYLHKLHNKWILYCVPPLICTSCITKHCTPHLHKFDFICTSCIANIYCAVFHPSSVQVQPHLHKLLNKWILYCVPPLICITKYCTVLHPSSAQVWLYLHKLHNKWILYCVPPLICTSCITNHCTPHLHQFDFTTQVA